MLKLFLLACFTVNVFVGSIPLDNPAIEGYVYGGKDTDIAQVPYHVALLSDGCYACGGFIVSPSHVVTAAKCTFFPEEWPYTIRAGSSKTREGGVVVSVKTIHRNPKFNRTSRDYDVAVLELATPLKLNDKTMKAVKLATKEPAPGSPALVSGWGGVDEEYERFQILQSATVEVFDRKMCHDEYKEHNRTITPRMICAGDGYKGSTVLDEGGALVHKGEVVGIYTFGRAWGQERTGEVYTNVANPEIYKFIKDMAKL